MYITICKKKNINMIYIQKYVKKEKNLNPNYYSEKLFYCFYNS